ncbi:ATP-binding protein [Fulvivirga sp. M361]|uniref:DEAD/DEAH box helicase n=1 Tax=Fulvivirga sp. M361 TaxID=2594266 RepID=UPI002107D1CF|nr:AAA domain-containing protein [Fulvivirga sp. M361]
MLRRLSADQFLDLHDLNFITESGSFSIIEHLIGGRRKVLSPLMDPRHEDTNLVSRRLKKLRRIDEFIQEERGSKDLYVGWPFVRGKFNDGTSVSCPVLFFPVTLDIQKDNWLLTPRVYEGITFNKSFFLAYSHYNDIPISDDFLDRSFEEFDDDSTVFRTALYQLLKDSPVEVNFNQENFQSVLQPFKVFKKPEFEEKHANGELKMFPEAVLGIFPQAGSQLVPDYVKLIEDNKIEDIDRFFEERTQAEPETHPGLKKYTFLDSVDEEKMVTPFKMDAHQENAIRAIKNGNSVVVQGPPGTGKSQLICNLISDHIAIGKKVLVVCQKRAALDVVYDRMHDIDMTDFVGLVHDFRNDRKNIYAKVARQIGRIDEYKIKNNGLDSIQLERKFLQNSRRIDQITAELEEFKYALFDESECGLSVKELYLTSDREKPVVNFRQEYTQFRFEDITAFSAKLKDYAEYALNHRASNYPWKERRSFKNYTVTDERKIIDILDDIPSYQDEIGALLEAQIGARLSLKDCEYFLGKRDYIVEMLGILKNKEAYRLFQHMASYSDDETSVLWLSNTERVLMECYKGVGPELSLASDMLGKFQETLQREMNARRSILRLIHWKLFSKDKFLIRRVLSENQLKRNRAGFNTMVEKIDNRLNLEHNITKLRGRDWVTGIPERYEKGHFQNWFYIIKLAVKAKLIFNSLRNFREFFNVQKLTFEEFRDQLEHIYQLIKDIPERKAQWLFYLNEGQISKGLENRGFIDEMKTTLRRDFESLCEFDKLRDGMMAYELQAVDKIMDELPDPSPEQVEALFQNSLRTAWIEHIETKYPVLRTVSSSRFLKTTAELQNCVRDKMQISNEMLLLRARERTYEKAEYNRLNNMVTYREVHHQVTKKKRIWPLRKLIGEYYEEVFDLMPCWMASPESVSAIFPMRSMFDLVIFDEASQCFVERGIPAMYRGRQLLIAGDDKQLKPSDVYQVRYGDEIDTDVPALEVDSLLSLADQHLMSVQLKGHYRSKSLDLIEFSNQHFYEGNLKLLPDYDVVNSAEPAIEYLKVDGIWENNTNHIEAEKVVEVLMEILDHHPDKEVGVVTFNAKQQQLILDLIDEKATSSEKVIPNNWFVKNIENVQGDEKDIILFSTAYAPDAKGKMAMHFGSLNAADGENRLNVAVTRAREKIMVISSIMPSQLKVEETKNDGPKLLKKYLEYALDVSKGKFKPSLMPADKRHAHWYLKQQLDKWLVDNFDAFTFKEELPFADITVKSSEQYLGLILTDDDLYYQSQSIKDAHVYTPFVLSKKKWNFTGVFSREFWNNREVVKENLSRFVNHHSKDETDQRG